MREICELVVRHLFRTRLNASVMGLSRRNEEIMRRPGNPENIFSVHFATCGLGKLKQLAYLNSGYQTYYIRPGGYGL